MDKNQDNQNKIMDQNKGKIEFMDCEEVFEDYFKERRINERDVDIRIQMKTSKWDNHTRKDYIEIETSDDVKSNHEF